MDLPLEIFRHICSVLQTEGSSSSLGVVRICSRQCYRIVTPYLYQNLPLTPYSIKRFVKLFFDGTHDTGPALLSLDSSHVDSMASSVGSDMDHVPGSRWRRNRLRLVKRITIIDNPNHTDEEVDRYLSTLSRTARDVYLDTAEYLFPNLTAVEIVPSSPNGTVTLWRSLFLHEACRPSHLYIEDPDGYSNLHNFINLFEGSVQTAEISGLDQHELPSPAAGTIALRLRYTKARCGEMCSSAYHPFTVEYPLTCRFSDYIHRGRKLYDACIDASVDVDRDRFKGWIIVQGGQGEREGEGEEGITWMVDYMKYLVEQLPSKRDASGEDIDRGINWKEMSDDERQRRYEGAKRFVNALEVMGDRDGT